MVLTWHVTEKCSETTAQIHTKHVLNIFHNSINYWSKTIPVTRFLACLNWSPSCNSLPVRKINSNYLSCTSINNEIKTQIQHAFNVSLLFLTAIQNGGIIMYLTHKFSVSKQLQTATAKQLSRPTFSIENTFLKWKKLDLSSWINTWVLPKQVWDWTGL